MSAELLTVHLLNGLSYSLLLFLMAAGLSLIFGLMGVINLAHGSFYLIGGYLALSITRELGSLWLALLLVPPACALIGVAFERGLLRRIYKRDHLDQVLVTLGFAYVVADLTRWGWGSAILAIPLPPELSGAASFLGVTYPQYRLVVIAAGLLIAAGLWWVETRTRVGAVVRAGVSDREMLEGLGVNVGLVFSLVFAAGAALAGVAGVVAGPILGVFPGVEFEVLIMTLIVVVVGGLGSLRGAFWGAILIGEAQTLGQVVAPELSLFVVFSMMALMLVARPAGLLGRAGAHA